MTERRRRTTVFVPRAILKASYLSVVPACALLAGCPNEQHSHDVVPLAVQAFGDANDYNQPIVLAVQAFDPDAATTDGGTGAPSGETGGG